MCYRTMELFLFYSVIQIMNQQFLTNFSVVVVKSLQADGSLQLGNESFIRSEISMSRNELESSFENSLFLVEIESGASEFRTPIEFQQQIVLRHKISNKYLSYSSEFQNEENDTTVRLELSDSKTFFKILPCFQYQTKISNKVKFNQDVYLATELSNAKHGCLTLRSGDRPHQMRAFIGLNYRTKIMFQSYYEREKEEPGYVYGQAVWLSHIESNTFLTTISPDAKDKEEIAFEELLPEEPLQSINGLWLIDSVKPETGGRLHFGDAFRLKNLCTGRYLAFSRNYKLVDNERIYSLQLQERPSQHSRFSFQSLKGEESRILKGSYLIFHHEESREYIGTRRTDRVEGSGCLPFKNFTEFEDQDLFEIIQLQEQAEQAIRFIFSIRREFKEIRKQLSRGKPVGKHKANQYRMLYLNIKLQLQKLARLPELFLEVQEELGFCIGQFCEHLKELRARAGQYLQQLLRLIYEIIVILCKDFRQNQVIGYNNLMVFAGDIFKNLGAEELLCEIFRNNYSLLCKGPNPVFEGCNLVNQMLKMVLTESNTEKTAPYWSKIGKVMNVLEVLTSFKAGRIDINQRLISSELFELNAFTRIFFDIKAVNQRIRMHHPSNKKWMEIDQVREPYLLVVLERIFSLFSQLCENRNFISKRYIHTYLSEQSKDSIEIIITYLNVLITKTFTNTLFSFITNCYIDSAPRISRHRPLALIVFQMQNNKESSRLSAEETIMSGRLKDALLGNAERSYATRPIDNQQVLIRPMTAEPSLSSEQLSFFKDYLTEKMIENGWTPSLLRSIRILMQLECYSVKQIQEIKSLLNKAILGGKLPKEIVEFAMEFFDEVCTFCLEEELKKINTYLQLQYSEKRDLTNKDIPSLLPLGKPLSLPILDGKQVQMLTGWQLKRRLIEDYNSHAEILEGLYAGSDLKGSVLDLFLADHNYSFSVHSIIFRMLQKFYLPKLQLVKLLSRSIIIPEEDVSTYDQLYAIYKRMKYIVSISENWINNPLQSQQHQEFLTLMNLLCNYMFGDLVQGDLGRLRAGLPANVKHQLLLNNFSLHLIVLELLNKNFYLIEGRTKKEAPKKVKDVFQICFAFLEYFCKSCPENTQQIISNIYIINRYLTLAEMGQIRLLSILYKEDDSLCRQLNIGFFQAVFSKIAKDGKENENCEFNPEYIEFLYICCWSKKEVIKRNLEMISKLLEKDSLFRRLLFMEKKDEKYRLCLEVVKFKSEPLHVPFIYHKEILKFLTFLIVKLQAAGNQLKNRLKQYISAEQLLQLLALPDIYSNTGVLPQLHFLLKKEVFPLLHVYFDKNDSLVRYYENNSLLELLNMYISMLANHKELKSLQVENEYLIIPFLRKHKKALDLWKINLRDHFEAEIRPLVQVFQTAIDKLPSKEKNKIYQRLVIILQNVSTESLTHNHTSEETIGMQMVNIRWRNFVDDDENNSPEEKYAKKNVLQLLRNPHTYELVEEEKREFFRLLKKEEKGFLAAMSRLVKMAVTEQSTLDQQQEAFQSFYVTVSSTADYLSWRSQSCQVDEERNWEGKELVETLINYVSRQTFNYNKPLARKSLFQILRIFNQFLQEDKSEGTLKIFYQILQGNHSCFRLFNCLKQCVSEASWRVDSDDYFDQINLVMSQIYLCGEERKPDIDKEALRFLGLLCRYQPFTEMLRSQPYSPSIDFLDKIYNSFYFMIRQNNSDTLILTASTIDISESIMDCLVSFLNGCSQANQNFIVDNKFTDIVAAALKLQNLDKNPLKVQVTRRNRLLDEIIQFYASNGINLAEVFLQRTKLLDNRGEYLLNRFKFSILRLLLQCTLANDRSTNKVRILVPNQLLKINLIWLYEDYVQAGEKFKEESIMRPREDWLEAISRQSFSVFLMIGFYYFHLIELNAHNEKENEDEEIEVTNDLQKQKEKIVKKFFSSISDEDRKVQKMKSLQKEPFAQEMKKFYVKYYTAYEFFKTKTLTIQANVFGNLVKLYFPKLPLCDLFTDQFKTEIIENAKRISQDEKLKSLIEFQSEVYEIIEGELQFQTQIESRSMVVGKLVKLMKNEEDVFLVVWILSCLIILLYLIDDFNNPVHNFSQAFASYLTPTYPLDLLLLLSSICNLFIGLMILVNLIVKKWPFLKSYYSRRYDQLELKEKGNFAVFILGKIISDTFYDIYVITFSVMSVTHPLFAGFLLVYIVSRISLGKQIVQAIVETWFSLAIAAALLIVFNYIYSIYIYTVSFTDDHGYGTTCTGLFRCLLMLVDQSLKSGSGFLGTAVGDDAFLYNVVNLKVMSEITYILFAQKVIFEIFSGTIIDKFSELREKEDATEEDEESKCYICGQERFQIDFELEGFEEHIQKTHNKFNYIYYLFYLRKKNKKDYGIEEKYIWSLHELQRNSWIPDGTSLLKQKKEAEEDQEKEEVKEVQHDKYYEKKILELKKVKQRIESYNGQLKDESNQ